MWNRWVRGQSGSGSDSAERLARSWSTAVADSAGVAVQRGEKIEIRLQRGKLVNLVRRSRRNPSLEPAVDWPYALGDPFIFACWNAHPHRRGSCTLVHNGIIEKLYPAQAAMRVMGIAQSETDTEVVAHS
ncbi:MAG: hypothetical protein U0361_21580 [Nitrospiraceae bacterium]